MRLTSASRRSINWSRKSVFSSTSITMIGRASGSSSLGSTGRRSWHRRRSGRRPHRGAWRGLEGNLVLGRSNRPGSRGERSRRNGRSARWHHRTLGRRSGRRRNQFQEGRDVLTEQHQSVHRRAVFAFLEEPCLSERKGLLEVAVREGRNVLSIVHKLV